MLRMTLSITLLCTVLFALPKPGLSADTNTDKPDAIDKYMSGVTALTSEGDNGEAYFSSDVKKLIYQPNSGGLECDKIWTMNIDGSDKQRVSPSWSLSCA